MSNILNILQDINSMKEKPLDISVIEEDENLTFFKIKDDEKDEFLKILEESKATEDYIKDTISSIDFDSKKNIKSISKEKKLEAFEIYNNSLKMIRDGYVSGADKLIDKAYLIYRRDVEILNLRGMIKLLMCDFSKALSCFKYASIYEHEKEYISNKYMNLFKSHEFEILLERYNHAIRFVNEGMDQEAIHILENLISEEPCLINPYVILSLVYKRLGKQEKYKLINEKLVKVDKSYNESNKHLNQEDNVTIDKKLKEKQLKNNKKIKGKYSAYIVLISIIAIIAIVFAFNGIKKANYLNSAVDEKNKKVTDLENKLVKQKQITDKQVDEKNKQLDNDKKQNQNNTDVMMDEESLFAKAVKLKDSNDLNGAIEYYTNIANNGKQKKYISESIYQLAVLNAKLKKNDESIKYYKKYINTYTKNDTYYDDCYYELGMLYYNMGDLKNAKNTFYSMRSEVPNSMYNNSKVKEILSKKEN